MSISLRALIVFQFTLYKSNLFFDFLIPLVHKITNIVMLMLLRMKPSLSEYLFLRHFIPLVMVRGAGLEPARPKAPASQTGAAANYATRT